MGFFDALIFGFVEGLTEFLPVSSTGHLILTAKLLGFDQDNWLKTFEISIQLGAILSVCFVFREKVFKRTELWKKLIVGFLPAGILGFAFYKTIKTLFDPRVVAYMLIFGGVVFILVELFLRKNPTIKSTDQISYKTALSLGFFQALAMVPGTSRSGATILGGILCGLDRKTAAEFSFLLAIPTMIAVTGFDILKHFHEFDSEKFGIIAVGFITAFLVAFLTMKIFLAFVSRFNFVPFGVYRIIIGIIFLVYIF